MLFDLIQRQVSHPGAGRSFLLESEAVVGATPAVTDVAASTPRTSAAAATAPTIFLALVDAFAAPMCAWNLSDACGFFCISVSVSSASGMAEMVDILLQIFLEYLYLLQRDQREVVSLAILWLCL